MNPQGRGTVLEFDPFERIATASARRQRLGEVIGRMKLKPEHSEDDVIDNDLILGTVYLVGRVRTNR